ncbi:hypothetical protein GY45DRAFT_1317193 [Cubamyces sp. BRFM 1775]|nr:hypothetical protein GY45DRAFT_1317193 [Cubamyces sp. BRFM 1775]
MSEPSPLTHSPAGPSSSFLHPSQPPPPGTVQEDDYAAAEAARRRFSRHGLLSSISLPSLRKRKSKAHRRDLSPSPSLLVPNERSASVSEIPELVNISESTSLAAELDEDYDKDVYRWAVLYENQRGAMVFSTPYYSALTLLPLDPPPFTIPTAIRSPRKNQPTVSLEDYPLPDGSWKWVSRAWMIDMRGDGQVQYDGFEYSRSFRSRKWGPDPGFMSNRGLVRRRRWIRLMMRPAQTRHDDLDSLVSTTPGALSVLPELPHADEGATRPPSVLLTAVEEGEAAVDVWRGDEGDWDRCHLALRHLNRDGRKLELWATWLGVPEGVSVSRRSSRVPSTFLHRSAGQSPMDRRDEDIAERTEADRLTVDTGATTSKAHSSFIIPVVRAHGSEILGVFVYPDSRAKFLQLLAQAGLLAELRAGMGASESVRALDFWSYTQDLEDISSSPSAS